MSSAFNVQYFVKVFPKIFTILAHYRCCGCCVIAGGPCFGMILALIRRFRVKMLYPISNVYVSFSLHPFIAQIFLLYYGMAQVFPFIRGCPALWRSAPSSP